MSVNALVEKGHEVVLVSNKGHEPKEDALDNRIQFYCLKYSGNLGYFLNAKELSILVKKNKANSNKCSLCQWVWNVSTDSKTSTVSFVCMGIRRI